MIEKLQKKLKIKMVDPNLLLQALTHSSFANENQNAKDNETLEFLGDAVIGLLMSTHLYKKGFKDEGELSKKRAQAVCEEALDIYANDFGLWKYLRIGKGLEATNSRKNPTINADAFEALFGAVYLDQGFEKTKELFNRLIEPLLDEVVHIKDYKSALQEYVQTDKRNVAYELVDEQGPSHNKLFTVAVKLVDDVLGIATAGSKKEAEQMAAKKALKNIYKE